MMPAVRIYRLADRPRALPTLAAWLHSEWLAPMGLPPERAEARLQRRMSRDTIPLALVALSEGQPVGTVSLVEDDEPSTDPERRYALSGLYVSPPWRRRGIGTRLCRRAVVEAKRLGLPDLRVYTPDRAAFYSRLGWQVVRNVMVGFGAETRSVTLLRLRVKPADKP